MSRFDYIGARGNGLKNQYIVLQVQDINGDVLKRKLSSMGQSSFIAPLAMMAMDNIPKEVVDIALPIAQAKLLDFGVTAKVYATDVPPAQGGRKKSEFLPGFVVGGSLVAVVATVGWGAWVLLFRRLLS